MSDKDLLRIGILVVGLLLLAAIWFFGRNPRKEQQGRRRESAAEARGGQSRREPSLEGAASGEADAAGGDYSGSDVSQPELGLADTDHYTAIS